MRREQTIDLRWGRSALPFAVPDAADLLQLREPERKLDPAAWQQGLANILPDSIPAGPVCVVVADKTRLCGYPQILPQLLSAMAERGAGPERIVFFIAYGTHARQSETESVAAYGPVYRDCRFVHHDSTERECFADLGLTSRGTPVRVRRELLDAGLVVTVGAISHHYFAGFGGGRKLLFPGLAEREAIYLNHRLFLDRKRRTLASGCRPGRLDGNPLAEDLAEIAGRLPPPVAIHALLDSRGEVARYRFGRHWSDFLDACQEHDRCFRARATKRYSLVLASAGGWPKDINLIQAHKAIDNAAAFVRDRGQLILLAECADGIGSDTFLPYFEMGGWEPAFDRLCRHYRGNGGTALAMMAKTGRIRIRLMTRLAPELCRRVGIEPIDSTEAQQLLIRAGADAAVIANASLLIAPDGLDDATA